MDDRRLAEMKRAMTERGWRWRHGKVIAYGIQLIVSDGAAEATLDFYPKHGRMVVGGADTPLRRTLTAMSAQRSTAVDQPPTPTVTEIGMDESGKGDWFGPLVVAAVALTPTQALALRQAGVRDSKELDAATLPKLAATIEQVVAPESRELLILVPERYNQRYAELQNINLLLAELYAETAAALVGRSGALPIVCDQFAQRAERLDSAFLRVGLPRPIQRHHAEASSMAVAAASVLATTSFQAELVRLGAVAGLGSALPKGSSALRLLSGSAQRIITREGEEALGRYAKLNFQPVRELLRRTVE